MKIRFSKIQQYVLKKLSDGEWHEESTLNCTRVTIKTLERKGVVEHHPKSGGGTWHWKLKN